MTKNVNNRKMWTLCRIMFWILPIVGLVGASNLSTAIIISGNRCDPDLCGKPEVCAICLMGIAGACLWGFFLPLKAIGWNGLLSEKSGKI